MKMATMVNKTCGTFRPQGREEFSTYIHRFELLMRDTHQSWRLWVGYLQYNLQGEAYDQYREMRSSEQRSYSSVKAHLLRVFPSKIKGRDYYRSSWAHLHQERGELLEHFCGRIEAMAPKVYPHMDSRGIAIEKMERLRTGLYDPELRDTIRAIDRHTWGRYTDGTTTQQPGGVPNAATHTRSEPTTAWVRTTTTGWPYPNETGR